MRVLSSQHPSYTPKRESVERFTNSTISSINFSTFKRGMHTFFVPSIFLNGSRYHSSFFTDPRLSPSSYSSGTVDHTERRHRGLRMLELWRKPLEMCFGGRSSDDDLLWHTDLKPHASGNYSIAVVQANSSLEDQAQVFTSPSATFVGVYDGHGGPEASRFITNHLFAFLNSKSQKIKYIYVIALLNF